MADPDETQEELHTHEAKGFDLTETVAETHKTAGLPPTTRESIFDLKHERPLQRQPRGRRRQRHSTEPDHRPDRPSGCGKSTLIRCSNRMNDLILAASVEGEIIYYGQNLYDPQIDPVEVRKRIGMVFQKLNLFPKSIYDNIAFGPWILGMKGNMDEIVEKALRGAAPGTRSRTGSRTTRTGCPAASSSAFCIARCMAVEPDVILMDEPCSALDPISTGKIEDLMMDLKEKYSIITVTHNMQQAARVSDMTAFLIVELDLTEKNRWGRVIEYDQTEKIFTNPADKRTEDYVSGKVG